MVFVISAQRTTKHIQGILYRHHVNSKHHFNPISHKPSLWICISHTAKWKTVQKLYQKYSRDLFLSNKNYKIYHCILSSSNALTTIFLSIFGSCQAGQNKNKQNKINSATNHSYPISPLQPNQTSNKQTAKKNKHRHQLQNPPFLIVCPAHWTLRLTKTRSNKSKHLHIDLQTHS